MLYKNAARVLYTLYSAIKMMGKSARICHPEIASIIRRLYRYLRDLLLGAFILLDFGKGHPHPSGKPDTFPYLGEGLLSLHATKFAKGSEKESLAAARSPSGENNTQLFSYTLRPLRYPQALSRSPSSVRDFGMTD